MNRSERNVVLALPLILLAGAGLAWAGSQQGISLSGVPVFAAAVGLIFLFQWVVFVPSYILRTERLYDLTGSITTITVAALAVALQSRGSVRTFLLLGLVAAWSLRLGAFLFLRIRSTGRDDRFNEIKQSLPRFLLAWTLQGLWLSVTLAAALAAITSTSAVPLGVPGWIGVAIWLIGFGVEALADEQKRRFKRGSPDGQAFIRTGLWAWSRHPNYFGEIMVWLGVAVLAGPALRGWQCIALVSPLFVTLLLTRISGIPILERRADARWGGQPDYEYYKRRTSVLIPKPPRRYAPSR